MNNLHDSTLGFDSDDSLRKGHNCIGIYLCVISDTEPSLMHNIHVQGLPNIHRHDKLSFYTHNITIKHHFATHSNSISSISTSCYHPQYITTETMFKTLQLATHT